ncbi:hypothetical protein ES705_17748 [subsurface metagenome]
MKAIFNRRMFSEKLITSDRLNQLGGIVHQFPKPGEYTGLNYNGKQECGSFVLTVSDNHKNSQVDIDLYSVNQQIGKFALAVGGYAVFYASQSSRGFSTVVYREAMKAKTEDKVFDSTSLKKGDLFYCHLLLPGKYTATNKIYKHEINILVSPLKIKSTYRELEPLTINVHSGGFKPQSAKIMAAQGLVFKVDTDSTISITRND